MKATVCKLTPEHGRHLRQLAAMMEEPLEDTLARVLTTGLDAIDSLDGLLWDWALELRDDADRAARVKARVKRRLKSHANGLYRRVLSQGPWLDCPMNLDAWRRKEANDIRAVLQEIDGLS